MDPDGLSLLVCGSTYFLSLVAVYYTGALRDVQGPGQRDDDALLGTTALWWGTVTAAALLRAGAVFAAALWLRRLPVAAVVAVVLCPAIDALLFALGAAHPPAALPQNKGAAALATLLGKPFLLLPRAVLRAAGLSARTPVTEQDLMAMVDDVQEGDFLDESQKEMLTGVFELDDIAAVDIMTHRTEVKAIADSRTAHEVLPLAIESGFSRLPVYHKNLDDIIGILYVKDLLSLVDDPAGADVPIHGFLRPAMFVPENCRARELLLDFRAKRTQIAIVVDEYGGTAGIVTMEDILEEIVGNIEDEFDPEDDELRPVEGGLLADGAADLEDVFDWFGLPMPDPEPEDDFDSVGGLITARLGRIPQQGEPVSFAYGGLLLRVEQVNERRIEKVFCQKQPQEATPKETEDYETDA